MFYKSFIICALCISSCNLFAENQAKPTTLSVSAIDRRIKILKDERAQCQLISNEASDKADRFLNSNDWLSYRRCLDIESKMQYRIQEIDEEIDILMHKKQEMMNKAK